MKRVLIGIFAHPDDEAFGPSATLIQEVRAGTELQLICVTDGTHGMNPDNVPDLGNTRRKEWEASGKAIGAKGLHWLGYEDGTLCNSMYHDIAAKIERNARDIAADPCELRFVTFAPNGLSGHLDHIAASSIAAYVFYRLKAAPPAGLKVKELMYYCLSHKQMPVASTDFVYMPCGVDSGYINHRVDVAGLFDEKVAVMRLHHTQRQDAATLLAFGKEFHSTDNFHILQ
ncbi:MAG TPA: PIG-L deacetylase family protein [Nevskiaceae bacterium]|nr:PIG-L deacetylase family protein [Nevskiaceae bacterium]